MATVTCPGCQERDERIAALERRVAELTATVQALTARLGTNGRHPDTPPSANPPGAPKPVTKKPTGKQSGGQPGHPLSGVGFDRAAGATGSPCASCAPAGHQVRRRLGGEAGPTRTFPGG